MAAEAHAAAVVDVPVRRRVGLWRAVLGTAEGRIGVSVGVVMLALIILGSIFAPETTYGAGAPGSGSSAEHWFGTDALGRDVLLRFLHGGDTVLLIPLVSVTLATILGGSLGLFAAYWGGRPDIVISKVFDVMLTIPPLLIVLVVIGAMGTSNVVLITTVAVVYAPALGRVVRATAQSVKVNPYVLSAQARGESDLAIVFREILPNVSGPVLAEFGLRLTYAILFVATLSFLGLGVQPPAPDWGLMVAENRGLLTIAPWGTLLPALGITALAVSFNMIADAISKCLAGDELSRLAVI
ncbi:MAG TPA: ABC transporter permease [Thermoleophilia bacterium]|nr:ABC transporter permease [Thermoleophilia bacterium]